MKRILFFLLLSGSLSAQQIIRSKPASYDGTRITFEQDKNLIGSIFRERPLDLEVEVEDVTIVLRRSYVFSENFKSNLKVKEKDLPVTYRGIVKGEQNSRATVTFYEDKVNGSYSIGAETYFFSPEEEFYNALPAMNKPFECNAENLTPPQGLPEIQKTGNIENNKKLPCIGIRLEVDKDVYDKFVTDGNLAGFIAGVWNEVFYLYEREGITLYLHEVVVHKNKEEYPCRSSYDCLKQLGENVKGGVKADLTQLWKLSSNASGGIAYVPGLCSFSSIYRTSYAGIESNYNIFPNYSWTVMVVAHELGHNFGSYHTHSCKWNGNNTAIDGCYTTEGSCDNPGIPHEGGTVMSYCHMTSAGINFNLGFGDQPGQAMRDRIANTDCLDDLCSSENDCIDIDLQVKFDFFPTEITWAIIDKDNMLVEQGIIKDKAYAGKVLDKKLCLPKGCYRLELVDTGGDGLKSSVGGCQIDGFFRLKNNGTDIFYASHWGKARSYEVCIDDPIQDNCSYISFNTKDIRKYTSQDMGKSEVDGTEIYIYGNAWKAIDFNYTITRKTIIEFEFRSDVMGEIHAIGFDTDLNSLRPLRAIQVYGDQRWGVQRNNTYDKGWKKYRIGIGAQYNDYKKSYLGEVNYMFFIADDDKKVGSNSMFRNIKVYEDGMCDTKELKSWDWWSAGMVIDDKIQVYPNPAQGSFRITTGINEKYVVYNFLGEIVHAGVNDGNDINISSLSAGGYIVANSAGASKIIIH